MNPIIMPGSKIDYMGETVTVGAVGITGGERYYWLTYADGAVAMIPATLVEIDDDDPRYTLTPLGESLTGGAK